MMFFEKMETGREEIGANKFYDMFIKKISMFFRHFLAGLAAKFAKSAKITPQNNFFLGKKSPLISKDAYFHTELKFH